MPPNQQTVNMLFHENITSKEEMVEWLDKRRPSKETGGQGAQTLNQAIIIWRHRMKYFIIPNVIRISPTKR